MVESLSMALCIADHSIKSEDDGACNDIRCSRITNDDAFAANDDALTAFVSIAHADVHA